MMAYISPAGFLGFTCLVLVQKFSPSSLSSVLRTYELDKWCVTRGPTITVLCLRLNKGDKTRDFREYPRFHGRERELLGERV